jgi:hypothetical protein
VQIVGVSLLVVMAVQSQFVGDYAVYPALPAWLTASLVTPVPDSNPANYRGVAGTKTAGPWAYLSDHPISERVPDIAPAVNPIRTKRKNVLYYRNGEFRPTLCSPRLCLLERPIEESQE